MLNGSNARFCLLDVPGLEFWQIGTDGGLLDAPVKVNKLLLAPGERADVIVDFAKVDGKTIVMKNSAPVPFPVGIKPDANIGQIMQFRVAKKVKGFVDPSFDPSAKNAALRGVAVAGAPALIPRITTAVPTTTRQLTLNEHLDPVTLMPLEFLVNNSMWDAMTTETPGLGTTEVREIVNLTVDAHPIHLHLVQFQIINRQAFDIKTYTTIYNAAFPTGAYQPGFGPPAGPAGYGTTTPLGGNPNIMPFLKGAPIAPDANENGWKDTVRMNPGEVTRIAVRFAPTDVAVGSTGTFGGVSAPFDPRLGPGYVWHCHIIDHEDNEMMRRYQVV